ncbi:MAG: ion channel, partial [Gemmatimonadaceae bacterium]
MPIDTRPQGESNPSSLTSEMEARDRDLGFGSVVAGEARRRLLNRDGSFNVERQGLSPSSSRSLYHWLVTMTWPRYLAIVAASLLATNALFATLYVSLGANALHAPADTGVNSHFLTAFFFSVQTFATIGYGQIIHVGLAPNILVTIESYYSILYVALVTGLVFARFARPTARLLFSEVGVIAPYRGRTAFMMRLVNARRSQLIDVTARVIVASWREENGKRVRAFDQLELERTTVSFLPLHWTIVHPIDESSPFARMTQEQFAAADPEFLVMMSGIDETFASIVHARTSYRGSELRWGARFADIYMRPEDEEDLSIDV